MGRKKDVTNEELLEFLKDNVATKEDLKALEVRMESVESKMATKEDLEQLATKAELQEGLDNLETKLSKRLDRIDENFTRLRGIKRIRELLDKL